MNNESIREFCLSLKGTTEDIKWGDNLCFMVANKLYCVTDLDGAFHVGFKVKDDEFEELVATDGIIPAPYMARNKWIGIVDPERFTEKEWKRYITQSYEIIKSKLPKKLQAELSGE